MFTIGHKILVNPSWWLEQWNRNRIL